MRKLYVVIKECISVHGRCMHGFNLVSCTLVSNITFYAKIIALPNIWHAYSAIADILVKHHLLVMNSEYSLSPYMMFFTKATPISNIDCKFCINKLESSLTYLCNQLLKFYYTHG